MTVFRAALVEPTGRCQTVVILDDAAVWDVIPEHLIALALDDSSPVAVGWMYADGEWSPPPTPEAEVSYFFVDDDALWIFVLGYGPRRLLRRTRVTDEEWAAILAAAGS